MERKTYRYYRGDKYHREEVTFEVPDDLYGTTTCCVSVTSLLYGITTHPCGSGADYRLSDQEQLDILETAERGRKEYTDAGIKTLDGWRASGISSFQDYCRPGDTVDETIVDYFLNSVPPHLMRSSCTQAGEPYSLEHDPKTGKYRNTWTTFHREDGSLWRFDGACFTGEIENRAGEMSQLARQLDILREKNA